MKTLYEILYGRKLNVSHFRTFGCPCTLLYLEATLKFTFKADDCYFVGYASTQPGSSGVNRDDEAKILHDLIKPSLILEDPALNDGASPAFTIVTEDAPTDSSQVVGEPPVVNQSASHEDALNSDLVDIFDSTLMDSLFPERIPDECRLMTSEILTEHDLKEFEFFLAYVSYMNFNVYQMDVKTAFLYGKVKEEIYIDQHPGFVNSKFPNHVYKLDKALYGLHQAPHAWYATLTDHLLQHGYTRGTIDQTLFIKRQNADQIIVQIYVDDIIFGSTSEALCKEFEQVMKKRFEMSSLGEMMMFLGLQAKQSSTNSQEF
ncbi:hypothetical protein L1887_24127 [Cichorium endivia]|nr:hypothetical protein L1887_24127 [Cichorium endivia]